MKCVDVWNFDLVEDVARFRDFEKPDNCEALRIPMELARAMLLLNAIAVIIAVVTAGVA
jgi:hypothetical protein